MPDFSGRDSNPVNSRVSVVELSLTIARLGPKEQQGKVTEKEYGRNRKFVTLHN